MKLVPFEVIPNVNVDSSSSMQLILPKKFRVLSETTDLGVSCSTIRSGDAQTGIRKSSQLRDE